MTKRIRPSMLTLMIFAMSLLSPLAVSAAPVELAWGSIDTSGLTTYGVYDTDNVTVLQTGDLVQLIWVGPDGVADPPSAGGAPGDDDVLLDSSSIQNGGTLPPPMQNKGYIPLVSYTFDDSLSGRVIYIRAWNSSSATTATAYGNSQTGTLAGGTTFNALRWNTGSPLAVQLASFSAEALSDSILVVWETVSEVDNLGFNLYRSQSPVAPETLLVMIPSQAPGSGQGYAYEWLDQNISVGETYYYWLESLDLNGHGTTHGPVSVTVQAPTAVGVTSFAASGARPGLLVGLTGSILLVLVCAAAATRRCTSGLRS